MATEFQLEAETMEVFRVAPPEDFLIWFSDHQSLCQALSSERLVRTPRFILSLKSWSRLANAELGVLSHMAQIEFEGIPIHAWGGLAAVDLLCPFCSVENIDPDTVTRRDLWICRCSSSSTEPPGQNSSPSQECWLSPSQLSLNHSSIQCATC